MHVPACKNNITTPNISFVPLLFFSIQFFHRIIELALFVLSSNRKESISQFTSFQFYNRSLNLFPRFSRNEDYLFIPFLVIDPSSELFPHRFNRNNSNRRVKKKKRNALEKLFSVKFSIREISFRWKRREEGEARWPTESGERGRVGGGRGRGGKNG